MNPQALAERVVGSMLAADSFSRWLGVELLDIEPGRCKLRMQVRDDMLNGFGRCHGGVVFSLADSALAFASNSRGRVAVSVENSLAYPAPAFPGDMLTALAEEQSHGDRISTFHVSVTNQDARKVGVFRGTVYRTRKTFPPSGAANPEPADREET